MIRFKLQMSCPRIFIITLPGAAALAATMPVLPFYTNDNCEPHNPEYPVTQEAAHISFEDYVKREVSSTSCPKRNNKSMNCVQQTDDCNAVVVSS
ncbi:hypothetical protein J6590_031674 [Homalodisca vitripennis]|nr:hypothetical protein J6590_031674 [Homalodisca vitripennis]